MILKIDYLIIDTAVFVMANLFNILLIGIFLARVKNWAHIEYTLGLVSISLALPVLAVIVFNIANRRQWWSYVLPLVLFSFLVLEFFLDYAFKLEFRKTALLWPYLVVYYASLMAMIGYSFLVKRIYGFITLVTYFLNLLATWYSYSKVGHG